MKLIEDPTIVNLSRIHFIDLLHFLSIGTFGHIDDVKANDSFEEIHNDNGAAILH